MERSAGILLPIFSLPSPYGIGSLGAEARAFVKFLSDAGQRWWQVLPVGPAGAGNSPYTSASTFAGNPLFVDLESLAERGLLSVADLAASRMPQGGLLDYPAVEKSHGALLRKAFAQIDEREAERVRAFESKTPWLREYALYQSAKDHFGGAPWYDWPDLALRGHESAAVERWREELKCEIAFHSWVQCCFFDQWAALKRHANERGVKIIGDLPIYVSLDSADVWSERGQFLLDGDGKPAAVAGVPPDYFSEEGQLWGNPLYDWPAQKRDGFGWWIRRVEGVSCLFDAVRLDHFRAFESYWAIPARAKSAKEGTWEKGPGMDLLSVLTAWFPQITYIAEDLGLLTDAVHALRRAALLPGMKVLEFAFSGPDNAYLPHNYGPHCVCYTGTHDNDTAVGWYTGATEAEQAYARAYLGVGDDARDVAQALLRCGSGSVAELFVAQMQDYLGLGTAARINVPGVANGNWRWRMEPGATSPALARQMRDLTHTFGRC
ncbi:4-alpha-glucanotransferase [Oscillibacter sp.]|uniref:4-alpha-glucanotransferase n=1 Tax=Oscillibacter sp. TaxID=1945593 RepID=UPI00262964FD|nr:4-alpha-glucanotransferase [Oscillibacter sp.]MDD3347007.1 4-alpha-glucanotransferase [Oscillibacter sp.]